jgi:hypothetical protein
MEKNTKNVFQAQKLKMADESPIWRRKHFFSDKIFRNENSSKKTFLLYFLTKNTTYVEQFFFLKIPNGGLIKMAICSTHF